MPDDILEAGASAAATTETTTTGAPAAPEAVSGAAGAAEAGEGTKVAPGGETAATGEAGPEGEATKAEGDVEAEVDPDWRDDWREKMAGGDDKALGILKRYGSPAGVAKALVELRKLQSTGALKKTLGEKPTEAELAAFRKDNGIPETAEAFAEAIKLPEGVELSDDGKKTIGSLAERLHSKNIAPAAAQVALDFYFEQTAAAEAAREAAAREALVDGTSTLKAEYGKEFKTNMTLANRYVAEHGGGDASGIMNIELANGLKLGEHPEVVRLFVNAARASADDETLIGAEPGSAGRSVETQYQEAMALLKTDPKTYWSPAHQEKVLKLRGALDSRKR